MWGEGGMDSNQKSHDKGLKLLKGALQNLLLDLPEGMGEASTVSGGFCTGTHQTMASIYQLSNFISN